MAQVLFQLKVQIKQERTGYEHCSSQLTQTKDALVGSCESLTSKISRDAFRTAITEIYQSQGVSQQVHSLSNLQRDLHSREERSRVCFNSENYFLGHFQRRTFELVDADWQEHRQEVCICISGEYELFD